MVKLPAAYNINKELKNISDSSVERGQKNTYFCPDPACNQVLKVRKGGKYTDHFAHKKATSCSGFETSLHLLAKLIFKENYLHCLENKLPFHLEYKEIKICNTCHGLNNLPESCELKPKKKLFDLTKKFDKISEEKEIQGFYADILLESSTTEEVILIEFAVTHKCEPEKISSGLRIIEFQIEEEDDLNFISNHKIAAKPNSCIYYNFNFKHKAENLFTVENCKKSFETFVVFRNGKAKKKKFRPIQIFNGSEKQNYLLFKNMDIENSGIKTFSALVKEASKNDIKVKNCYACRFSTINDSYFQIHQIWCKKHRAEIPNSNDGNKCSKFWRIAKSENDSVEYEKQNFIESESDQVFFSNLLGKRTGEKLDDFEKKEEKLKELGYEIFNYRFDDRGDNITCPMQKKLVPHTFCTSCAFSNEDLENKIACGFKNKIK